MKNKTYTLTLTQKEFDSLKFALDWALDDLDTNIEETYDPDDDNELVTEWKAHRRVIQKLYTRLGKEA